MRIHNTVYNNINKIPKYCGHGTRISPPTHPPNHNKASTCHTERSIRRDERKVAIIAVLADGKKGCGKLLLFCEKHVFPSTLAPLFMYVPVTKFIVPD
jgi:hypothetical protein